MAKKTKSYSQVQATDALEQLGQRGTSARTLSMTFCAYSPDMATVKYDAPKMEFQN